ncbi:MAG: acyl-CoA thioester hydrolase [Myxococcota bacterium]|jgi:acyl-CoA thioester hydrolase
MIHSHRVRIYYEDTDLSGLVYHANYLRYMERAREHLLGPDELVRLYEQESIGFVVYHAALTYKQGARLGDVIEVRTTVKAESDFRLVFQQNTWRTDSETLMVDGLIHLVCVDANNKLVRVPLSVLEQLQT